MAGPSEYEASLEFTFEHFSEQEAEVPAFLLAQTLDAAQRACLLLAMAEERREIGIRARFPAEIERQYQLRCRVPRRGSYVLPTALVSAQPEFPKSANLTTVVAKFQSAAETIAAGDRQTLADVVVDSAIRYRLLETFRAMAPRPGSGWTVTVGRSGHRVRLDSTFYSSAKRLAERVDTQPRLDTLNGRLISINFAEHKVTIVPLGSQHQVECVYDVSLEDLLYENRRSEIQVTGEIILGPTGEVQRILSVQSITDLDLSPFEVSNFKAAALHLRFRSPLVVTPELDADTQQWLVLRQDNIGLDVFAKTRDELEQELYSQLSLLWLEYALGDEAELSPGAQWLRRNLHEAIEIRPDAAA
jgi:hypothetical protein